MSLSTFRVPKDFESPETKTADMSPLHRARCYAAHEVTSGKEIEDESWKRGKQCCGRVDVVFDYAGRGRRYRVELHGHRHVLTAGEDLPEQVIVPDAGRLQDRCNDHNV